jgi:thiol-disulfide isomerase/thioredoxin
MKHMLIVTALIGLTVLSACGGEDSSRGYIVKVGDPAPNLLLYHLNGDVKLLNSLRGRVVMLQFTASWCSVCRKEMPRIESDIWQKYKDRPDFALFGVDYKERPDVVRKFAASIPVTYPMTIDDSGFNFHRFARKGAGVTRNVIIDRQGKIAFLTRLYDEQEFTAMVAVIDSLLEKTAPPPAENEIDPERAKRIKETFGPDILPFLL